MTLHPVIGLSGVGAVLAPQQLEIEQLATAGLVQSTPGVLREFGFNRAHLADLTCEPGALALDAARRALADARLKPADIDLLVWASARPENHVRPKAGTTMDLFDGFRYQSGWLQEELGLESADVIAVAQQGCSTMFAALRAARAILMTEPERSHALCVAADVLPHGAPREILYNVISDGACAVVLSRGCSTDRWIGFRQISSGYYWDPVERAPEIMAAYFVMGRQVIRELLDQHHVDPDQIEVVIPTGINRSSWDVMLGVVGIPKDRLYDGPPSFGHTISADSFIHLEHLRRNASVRSGARLLMFTYGFGSTWCALLLEH